MKRECFAMLAMKKKSFAFTLAEVLIVLAVLGVIAAMTIPTLIQDAREKALITALKKNYTIFSQAVDMAVAENGPVETWNWSSATNAFANIKPYLKIEKDCGTGTGCWYNGMITSLTGTNWVDMNNAASRAKVLLADGTSLALYSYGSCNTSYGTSNALKHICGSITVDINGANNPNTYGKDLFQFWITSEGIIPTGVPSNNGQPISNRCNLNSTVFTNGEACAGWIIIKGNMDYLHKTVSW